ncbi:MAG TPA: cation transporter [Chitinophagaceae bacterium]|nr:cation transporter [Chitinophagaceae bacterium]
MKKLQLLLVLTFALSAVTFGQTKKAVQTVTIKTPTVQCESCKKRIENFISREDGVNKVVADYKRKTVKITYVTDRTNVENLKTAIANIGYDADDVTANQESYKKLPLCCKKPEDGGGMKE